jgi:hypothetical protein
MTVIYGYDASSLASSIDYGSVGSLIYGHDANGRRVDVGESITQNTYGAVGIWSRPLATVGVQN